MPLGEETHLGKGYTQGGRVVQFGEGCPPRGGACPWGRGIPQEEGMPVGGPTFSPGLHSARLTGVHIPDVAGHVSEELKLGQCCRERAERREAGGPPLGASD